MPLIRGTFFFKNILGAGWSETIYADVANLSQAIANAQKLLPLRVALEGTGVELSYIRVSDDLVKRDSQIIAVPPGDKAPLRASDSDLANVDLVIRIEAGTTFTVRRTLAMRGIPGAVIGRAGAFVPQPAFSTAFLIWAQELIFSNWAVRFRDKTVPVFPVAGAAQNLANGIVTVTTQIGNTFVPGDQVIIKNVVGAIEINGLWTILQTPTPTTFTIHTNQIVGAYIGGGTVNKNNFALARINNVQIIRCATHRAGRPFDSLRGRRRARVRR